MPADDEPILRKIQALVDKAYSTTFDAERDALLAKADELMLKYSIDQVQLLDPSRPNTAPNVKGSTPELREITFLFSEDGHVDYEVRSALSRLFQYTAEHMFVRIGARGHSTAKCVGYPADLDMMEMFYLRLKMHMVASLDPRPDPRVPWVESMANLKNVGFKWERIHYKLSAANLSDYPYTDQSWERKMGVRFTAEMKRWSEVHGEVRNMAGNLNNWRYDFIDSFVYTLGQRMREARAKTVSNDANLPALINDKKSDVQEAFYQEFPDLRPHPKDCECDTCHFNRCNDETCTRPRCVNWRKNRNKPIPKSHYRRRNISAEALGRQAARNVDLGTGGQLHG